MYLRCILGNLAPLIILAAAITLSTAHPLPGSSRAETLPVPQTLGKRSNPVTISGLTLRKSQSLIAILPLQIAASQFESLYATLYQRAIQGLYNGYLSSNSFTLQDGTFEISFVASSGGDVGMGEEQGAMMIPWEFVGDFAIMMRGMSARGFTGCYDQGYWNEMGTFGIYVGLRVLGAVS